MKLLDLAQLQHQEIDGVFEQWEIPSLLVIPIRRKLTGALKLVQGGAVRMIGYANGAPTVAASSVAEERLGPLLQRRGAVAAEQLSAIDTLMRTEGLQFGAAAIRIGILSKPELARWLREQHTYVVSRALSTESVRASFGPLGKLTANRSGMHLFTAIEDGIRAYPLDLRESLQAQIGAQEFTIPDGAAEQVQEIGCSASVSQLLAAQGGASHSLQDYLACSEDDDPLVPILTLVLTGIATPEGLTVAPDTTEATVAQTEAAVPARPPLPAEQSSPAAIAPPAPDLQPIPVPIPVVAEAAPVHKPVTNKADLDALLGHRPPLQPTPISEVSASPPPRAVEQVSEVPVAPEPPRVVPQHHEIPQPPATIAPPAAVATTHKVETPTPAATPDSGGNKSVSTEALKDILAVVQQAQPRPRAGISVTTVFLLMLIAFGGGALAAWLMLSKDTRPVTTTPAIATATSRKDAATPPAAANPPSPTPPSPSPAGDTTATPTTPPRGEETTEKTPPTKEEPTKPSAATATEVTQPKTTDDQPAPAPKPVRVKPPKRQAEPATPKENTPDETTADAAKPSPTKAKPADAGAGSGDVAARLANARRMLEAGSYRRVLSICNEILAIDPRNAGAYRSLGAAYAALGATPQACESYRRYLRFAPNAPDKQQVESILTSCE